MKKVLAILMALLLVVCAASCGEKKADEKDHLERIKESGKLIIAMEGNWSPWTYHDESGALVGFDTEVAAAIAEKLGVTPEYVEGAWEGLFMGLSNGRYDVIVNGVGITDERKDTYDFSIPYAFNTTVLIVKSDNTEITTLADLKDKHVMTQADSAGLDVLTDPEGDYAAIAKTFAGGAPETLGDYNNIFMQLESGAVDAVVCDLSVAARQMAAKPDAFKQVEELNAETFGVGFKLGDEATAATVSKTLKEMYADGTVAKILEKYADQAVSIDNWLLK